VTKAYAKHINSQLFLRVLFLYGGPALAFRERVILVLWETPRHEEQGGGKAEC